jgi:ATP-dependent DNA helicase RecG
MNIRSLSFLTPREKEILIKNNIRTFEQLLYFFPFRFEEAPRAKQIQDIQVGDIVTISGVVVDIEAKTGYQSGAKYTKAIIQDNTDTIQCIWWNMPFISKTIFVDQKIILTGTVAERGGDMYLNNPKVEKVKTLPINADSTLFANTEKKPQTGVYSNFRNVKNFYIKKVIERAIKSKEFKDLEDLIPKSISQKLHLGTRQNAIVRKHFPVDENDKVVTNKYFAFEEIFVMQIYREQEKVLREDAHAYKVNIDENFWEELKNILPFKLTKGQQKVLDTILDDIAKNKPMSRLVEGDVGSGKTILALAASLATVLTPVKNAKCLQVAYIAPTEILASQHFEFFIKILSKFTHLNIALLTSSGAKIYPSKLDREKWTTAPKSRVKKLLDEGKLNIVIGTHSLFNKNILFEYLGLVIIDEQHRFGVKQRLAMIEKHKEELVWKNTRRRAKNDLREFTGSDFEDEIKLLPIPHLLSMSATPIPRTLALTIYGDLDLSILDELPPGRKRAETKIITAADRKNMYKVLEEKLLLGKQAYIIAPRIFDDLEQENEQKRLYDHKKVAEKITGKNQAEGSGREISFVNSPSNKKSSVEFEEKRIKEWLKDKKLDFKIGILHGRQNKVEKEKVIEKFYSKEIDILISTTVVEVGISVPNATCIIIENADNFGLAQLHQLRGRVERSTDHSICFLVTESENESSLKRLEALAKSNNGFELAEVDLSERGAGSLIGNRQSGLTDIGMEAIKNRKLVEVAKEEAKKLLESDPNLHDPTHKLLKQKIDEFTFHEE